MTQARQLPPGPLPRFALNMIDRWKARLGRRAKSTPDLPRFWWAFGLDQYAHVLRQLQQEEGKAIIQVERNDPEVGPLFLGA